MSQDERAKLLEKKARIDARLKALAIADQKQKRKDDTRRKIITGALALEHATINAEFGAQLASLLNRYVERPEDRALFDFLDDRVSDVQPAKTEQDPTDSFATVAAVAREFGTDPVEPQQESA